MSGKRVNLFALIFIFTIYPFSMAQGSPSLDCSGAHASKKVISHPNNKMQNIKIKGIKGAKNITIQCISQDEPIGNNNGTQKGKHEHKNKELFDASGIGKSKAAIRRERADEGNGRVYHIDFIATAKHGEQCSGTVKVSVPLNKKTPAIDDGPIFNSTGDSVNCGGEPVNNPPSIISTPTKSANVGEEYVYQIEAVDSDSDSLIYFLTESPSGMYVNKESGLITWLPTAEQTGSNNVVLNVTDNKGATTAQSFEILVITLNHSPEIISTPVTTVPEGQPYSYQVLASDQDGDKLNYQLVQSPKSMSIDAFGVVTWTPGFSGSGLYGVEINVSDSHGASVSQQFELLVTNTNQIPTAVSKMLETDGSTSVNISLEGNDLDGDTLLYYVVSEPTNGVLTGTGNQQTYLANPNFSGTDTFTYVVNDGLSDSLIATVSIIVTHVNTAPVINISSPETGNSFQEGSVVLLSGSAIDQEDGDISQNIVWVSNIDGIIGQGASLSNVLSPGAHTIQASVSDSNNENSTSTVTLRVLPENSTISLNLNTSTVDIQLTPDEHDNLTTTLNFLSNDFANYTVLITQEIESIWGELNNVSITPVISDTFIVSSDMSKTYSQDISAYERGLYEITTVAEILETGDITKSVTRLTINKNTPPVLVLSEPASYPGVLSFDSVSSVLFTTKVRYSDRVTPIEIALTGDVSLMLNDEGKNGDIKAGDGTYSGTIDVDTAGHAIDSCLIITASAVQGGLESTSDSMELCISPFTAQMASSDISETNIIEDSITGSEIIANELIIKVYSSVLFDDIFAIADSVNAEIVRAMPEINMYQLRFSTPFYDISELELVIDLLEQNQHIFSASTHGISTILSSVDDADQITPKDPEFRFQSGLRLIHAPQAWNFAIGAATIAVIDTGVDSSHPDLSSKIIKGFDFIDGGDPDDAHGHGTHVAGIASAKTDNNVGIAGTSWESSILAIRAFNADGQGSSVDVASAIMYAANHGARIINVSARSFIDRDLLCNAVSYATGKGSIVVAGAGKTGTSVERYPAACPGAVAVGNTNDNDTRYSTSPFGSWVDLAAPGVNVLSTVPGFAPSPQHPSELEYYAPDTGTSMSSPMVAGALAVVMDREPGFSNKEALQRLKDTAVPLPGQELGAGRIDLYEAMFPPNQLISDVIFDDANYELCVLNTANSNSWVYVDEVFKLFCENKEITNIKGTKAFTELKFLRLQSNNLSNIDLSNNTALVELNISNNNLSSLDVSQTPELWKLDASNNALNHLYINASPTKLREIKVANNNLSGLDVSNMAALRTLSIENNNMNSLNVSNNVVLNWLYISNNNLNSLDVSKNIELVWLISSHNNLMRVDVSNNVMLEKLVLSESNLSNLDVSNNTQLTMIDVSNNNLNDLDVRNLTKLRSLNVFKNSFNSLDVSNNNGLTMLYASYNNLAGLNVRNNLELMYIDASYNNLINLNVANNHLLRYLYVKDNNLNSIDVSNNIILEQMDISNNFLNSINIDSNTNLIHFRIYRNPLTDSAMNYLESLGFIHFCSTTIGTQDEDDPRWCPL